MNVSTKAKARATYAAKEGLNKAFTIGFCDGAVMGIPVVSIELPGGSIISGYRRP